MKLNSLKLRGFTGVKKGMGLDEIELDLSGLSGLIAFSGHNGAGKTTVLESLQPYRTLASRKGTLANHVFLRDACKELEFDFQGDRYQTKILIDADNGKQEGYIWLNGEPVVDGKARSYDAYIEELFGSRDLFFNSIFCAQNASKLSDLTTGKLKELFAEFLRLDQYIAYEQATKRCIALLSSQGTIYDSRIDSLKNRLAAFGDLDSEKKETFLALERAENDRESCQNRIVALTTRIEQDKAAIANNKALETRAKDFQARIQSIEAAMKSVQDAYEKQAQGLRLQIKEHNADIKKLAAILDNKDAIEDAIVRKKDLEKQIDAKTNEINRSYHDREQLRKRGQEIDDALKQIDRHPQERELPILAAQIGGLKQSAKALDTRDPECVSTVCGFITGALLAQEELPKLEQKKAEIQKAVDAHNLENRRTENALQAERDQLWAKINAISESLKAAERDSDALKRQRVKLSDLADKQADLREAVTKKEYAEKRKEELTAQGMELKAAHDTQAEQWEAELKDLRGSLADIERQIDHQADNRVRELETEKKDEEKNLKDYDEILKGLEAKIRTLENQQAERATLQKELADVEGKAQALKQQVSEWTYLRNALSANGIRALEIDAVAPSISAYANQILFNTFGPGYTVKLRTQDDEGREVLDILALEPDGRETMLENLSGGEQVWSLKALRLAMTLIAKHKSRKALGSCFCDEEDGSLDEANAENFINMYRAFMEAGGFDTCFFISHRPRCIELANNVIRFSESGLTIN